MPDFLGGVPTAEQFDNLTARLPDEIRWATAAISNIGKTDIEGLRLIASRVERFWRKSRWIVANCCYNSETLRQFRLKKYTFDPTALQRDWGIWDRAMYEMERLSAMVNVARARAEDKEL